MRPDRRFYEKPKEFWANIRTLSQKIGYTHRGTKAAPGPIRVPTLLDCKAALEAIDLTASHLVDKSGRPTTMGEEVIGYFAYRADVLNTVVRPLLMDADRAKETYEALQAKFGKHEFVPMNKQAGAMKRPAYFTGIINTLIRERLGELPCNYNPQELTTITWNKAPFRTLARRIDGAFPRPVDPIAVWEIKEYYYTTTFGSRVADGVYESLLDGLELEELDAGLREVSKLEPHTTHIQHLLMVDAYFTWWIKGRSYLCRIIDMLHMGYADEVLFGIEVIERLPVIVDEWIEAYRAQKAKASNATTSRGSPKTKKNSRPRNA